jgi:hypothetical protein
MNGDVALVSALERLVSAVERLAASLETEKRLPAPSKPGLPVENMKPGLSLETLRIQLTTWLPDLETTAGLDGSFTVKPCRYLHQTWSQVNDAIRKLGGAWVSNGKQGSWRIPPVTR